MKQHFETLIPVTDLAAMKRIHLPSYGKSCKSIHSLLVVRLWLCDPAKVRTLTWTGAFKGNDSFNCNNI